MAGNLVVNVATPGALQNRGDLHATTRMVRRLADARICR